MSLRLVPFWLCLWCNWNACHCWLIRIGGLWPATTATETRRETFDPVWGRGERKVVRGRFEERTNKANTALITREDRLTLSELGAKRRQISSIALEI